MTHSGKKLACHFAPSIHKKSRLQEDETKRRKILQNPKEVVACPFQILHGKHAWTGGGLCPGHVGQGQRTVLESTKGNVLSTRSLNLGSEPLRKRATLQNEFSEQRLVSSLPADNSMA
jgi:hypothetical protein